MGIYGKQTHDAMVLAIDEVNAAGGINGAQVELVSYDEASRREQVVAIMERLIKRDQVLAIHGPTGTDMAKAGWPYAAENGVPVIASTTAPKMTDIGTCTFRYSLPESALYPVAAAAVKAKFQPKSAVLVYAKDESYSATNAPFMEAALKEVGISVLASLTHSMQDVDFSALVTRIKALNPDIIAMTALPEPGINLMREARRQGMTQRFVGGNAFNTPKIIELGKEAAEGLVVATPWFMGNTDPANQKFVASYQKRYGKQPDQFAAQAYHGLLVMFEGIRTAKLGADVKANRQAICEGMKRAKAVSGPLGQFTFDGTRTPVAEAVAVIEVKQGQFALFK